MDLYSSKSGSCGLRYIESSHNRAIIFTGIEGPSILCMRQNLLDPLKPCKKYVPPTAEGPLPVKSDNSLSPKTVKTSKNVCYVKDIRHSTYPGVPFYRLVVTNDMKGVSQIYFFSR